MNDKAAGEIPLEERADEWVRRIDDKRITFADVVRFKYWQTLDPKDHRRRHELGQEFYGRARETFMDVSRGTGLYARYGTEMAVFGDCGCGVCLLPLGRQRVTVIEKASGSTGRPRSPFSIGSTRWRSAPASTGPRTPSSHRHPASRSPRSHPARRSPPATTGACAAWMRNGVLTSSGATSSRHRFCAVHLERLRVASVATGPGGDATTRAAKPSPEFVARLKVLEPQVKQAEALLEQAAQRYAQVRYARGMLTGVAILVVACALLGLAFAIWDVQAWNGVALLAGGLGAVVSVLQRMTFGRLRLDYNAGPGMLSALGAVRPLIGAIIGMVLFCFVEGGWLPAVEASFKSPLAFYAGLGFLAGFNERWAQDMLVGSARTMKDRAFASAPASGAAAEDEKREPGAGA